MRDKLGIPLDKGDIVLFINGNNLLKGTIAQINFDGIIIHYSIFSTTIKPERIISLKHIPEILDKYYPELNL